MLRYYTILVFVLIFSTFFPHTSHADPEDSVRFYIGSKLGYHGLIPSKLHDSSVNALNNPVPFTLDSNVLSVFTIGATGGIHIPINSRFRSRTELEYLYHFEGKTHKLNDGTQQFSKMNIASHTLLINSYIDYDIVQFVALYLGFGLGMSILEVDIEKNRYNSTFKASSVITNFAWQIGIGTRIELTEYIFLDANFRYLNIGPVQQFGAPYTVRMYNGDNNAIELLFSASYVF